MSCPIPFRFLPTLCVRGGKGWCLQCCQGRHPGRWPCGHECLRRFRKVSVARFLKLLVTSCPSDLPSLPFVDLFFIWFCYSWGWPKTWCSLWQPFLGSNSTRHKRDTLILFGSCHDTSPLGSIFLGDMCFSGCLADSVLLRRHVINWPLFWGMSIVTGLLLDVAVASSMNATLRGAWPGWEHRKPFFFSKKHRGSEWELRLAETFWDFLGLAWVYHWRQSHLSGAGTEGAVCPGSIGLSGHGIMAETPVHNCAQRFKRFRRHTAKRLDKRTNKKMIKADLTSEVPSRWRMHSGTNHTTQRARLKWTMESLACKWKDEPIFRILVFLAAFLRTAMQSWISSINGLAGLPMWQQQVVVAMLPFIWHRCLKTLKSQDARTFTVMPTVYVE